MLCSSELWIYCAVGFRGDFIQIIITFLIAGLSSTWWLQDSSTIYVKLVSIWFGNVPSRQYRILNSKSHGVLFSILLLSHSRVTRACDEDNTDIKWVIRFVHKRYRKLTPHFMYIEYFKMVTMYEPMRLLVANHSGIFHVITWAEMVEQCCI